MTASPLGQAHRRYENALSSSPNPTLDLYVTHRSNLVRYAKGIIGDPAQAEEIVQDAFVRFTSAAERSQVNDPSGYLYRIVRNLAIDSRRRKNTEQRLIRECGAQTEDTPDNRPSPEIEVAARDELQRVLNAMAELPERTRIALEMHRFGGCKLSEIAAHLGISVSMAQVLVIEGVKHCQRRL